MTKIFMGEYCEIKGKYPKEIVIKEREKGLWERWEQNVLESDAVVCGEFHGSCENWEVYRFLLEKGLFGGFAYELPVQWQEHVRNYITYKKPFPGDLLDIWIGRNGKRKFDDGKISKEFIQFLDWFSQFQKQLPLIFFDAWSSGKGFSWNERDKGMCNNFMAEKKRLGITKPVLVGCGGLHARTTPFMLHKESAYPLAYHLSRQLNIVSSSFNYLSGTALNIKEKAVSHNKFDPKSPSFC